jgi:selenocysteine lyase/cysteine desulfurase
MSQRAGGISRRRFAYLFSLGGSAALMADPAFAAWMARASRRREAIGAASGGEGTWEAVRRQFLMPPGFRLFNAANLCPSPEPVLKALSEQTRRMDETPSPAVRDEMHAVKEQVRARLAAYLRVTPEEILITRNTSEGNNLVSSGLDLGPGDEVVVFADNHPSNLAAWREKGRRFGYTVTVLESPNPHPGADHYVEAVRRALTPRTKVLAFSHLTNTVGDVLPARDLCALARERAVLSLVDGAQTFGAFDVDLRDMDPDFYTGSAHKWPCGPLEAGVLFVNRRAQPRFWPSVVSAYPGQTGLSKTHEGLGQRDEPAILAFGEAIAFQSRLGMKAIEARTRELGQALIAGLRRIDGITLWTHPDPARSAGVVSFRPGTLDPRTLASALFERDGIVCAVRGGEDRGGIRLSPHIYNSHADVERAVEAVARAMRSGV